MKYLIDSHVLLWLIAESHKVGTKTKELLQEEDAKVYVSVASLWELSLKAGKGKLPITAKSILTGVDLSHIDTIDITAAHIKSFDQTTTNHADPFDLMLCAQAKTEDMVLITADKILLDIFPDSLDALQ